MKIKTAHQLYMKQVEARKKKVRALRAQKLTWKAIGLVMGISRQRAEQLGRIK
jgi:DNA-directed RNA polymerase specialized sigma subunit